MTVGNQQIDAWRRLNIQPVIPFGVSKSTNIILRVIMPLTSQPGEVGTRINGLGDIVATAFFTPAASGPVIWGLGPAMLLPAATNSALGSEKFGIGPSAVVLMQPGKWTLGFLVNQIWSTSGANDRSDVNSMFLQPFANYNFGAGLSAGMTIESTANWDADETWTAPMLFNISKVTLLGKRPVSPDGRRRSDNRQSFRRSQLAVPAGGDVPLSAVEGFPPAGAAVTAKPDHLPVPGSGTPQQSP